MAYLHLTLAHCKGQDEGHEYLRNGDTGQTITIAIK